MENFVYFIIFGLVVFVIVIGVLSISKDKSGVLDKAQRLIEAGNYDGAAEIYNKLILHDEFNPLFHALLADLYFNTNNYQRSVMEYELALKNAKDLPPGEASNIHRDLGISYYQLKNYPKAFLSLFNAYLVNPNDGELCMYIGLIYASQRKFQKALDYLNKAESNAPMNFEVHYYLGIIATQLNKREVAIRQFTLAKKIRPNDYRLDVFIGTLYLELKDYMSATRHLKIASKMLNDMELKMKCFLLLGECYKGVGLIEDAVTTLEMASQETLNANDSKAFEQKKNILYQLGMAYIKDGNKSKALETWQNLKSMDFFYKDIKELTSQEISDEALTHVSERWMVMPSVSVRDIIKADELVSKQLFDIDTLEKTVEQNVAQPEKISGSFIEQFRHLNIRKFREASRKVLKFMGFSVGKELTLNYDSDFKEGKALAFVGSKSGKQYFILIKRYEEDVSGVVIMNAVGTARSMRLENVVVIVSSRFNPEALSMTKKYKNLTIIDRRGLIKALKYALT